MEHSFNEQRLSLQVCNLPRHRANFGLDVGSTLAKLAYIEKSEQKQSNHVTLRLMSFNAGHLEACLNYIREKVVILNDHPLTVYVTGIGCIKHQRAIAKTTGVKVNADGDELVHAARGVDILWHHLAPSELLYPESDVTGLAFGTSLADSGLLPCLLVNIGSALTICKIEKDMRSIRVVGGSAQGGMTFLGLGALLTKAKTYTELIGLAERGDRRNVDVLVKDMAGGDYSVAVADQMVSSFGKAAPSYPTSTEQQTKCPGERTFTEEDLASSLLFCITDQLTQSAYLVAQAQGVSRAIFCGSFIAHNRTIMSQINEKLRVCSELLPVRQMFALFS